MVARQLEHVRSARQHRRSHGGGEHALRHVVRVCAVSRILYRTYVVMVLARHLRSAKAKQSRALVARSLTCSRGMRPRVGLARQQAQGPWLGILGSQSRCDITPTVKAHLCAGPGILGFVTRGCEKIILLGLGLLTITPHLYRKLSPHVCWILLIHSSFRHTQAACSIQCWIFHIRSMWFRCQRGYWRVAVFGAALT